jgi:hypothetical protein
MTEEDFARLLAWAYRGEVSGEDLFADLGQRFPQHRSKLAVLAALETKSARRGLRPQSLNRPGSKSAP